MMDAQTFWDDVTAAERPPVFLPDIGTFFNRDLEQAQRLVRTIHASGVRYLKGEILHTADICLDTEASEQYLNRDAQPVRESYRRLVERKVVPLADYERLFSPCRALGMGLVLSVYDHAGADFAAAIGACALKIASTNLVHAPLIRHVAGLGQPMIVDTGRATLDEVWRTLDWARQAGATRIVLEYSPPAPPAPVTDHNLRVFETLAEGFDGPLGLSDHHAGEEMLYAATVLGCRALEKGVCADDQPPDQDVFHALPVGQLPAVLQRYRNIHAALGHAAAAYAPPPKRSPARMGLVAARQIRAGESLDEDNVRFAFPTVGIPVEDWDQVRGHPVVRDIAADRPLEWRHVDRPAT